MANKNRPSFYTGVDSESVRLSDNNDPGTTDQRKAWKRAIAQEQQDTIRELGRGATLADLGILDKKEEGRARFNFFGGEQGAKREGEQYGAKAAQKNVQFQQWIPDGQGGYIDPYNDGSVRGRYDQFGRPVGQKYQMGSNGLSRPNSAWGGTGPGTGTPTQQGYIDYTGGGGYGTLPNNNYTTGNTGTSNSSSVTTPTVPGYIRNRQSSGGWGGVPTGGVKPAPGLQTQNPTYYGLPTQNNQTSGTGQTVPPAFQQGPTMYNNNPTLGLPSRTGGIKPSKPQSAWGG